MRRDWVPRRAKSASGPKILGGGNPVCVSFGVDHPVVHEPVCDQTLETPSWPSDKKRQNMLRDRRCKILESSSCDSSGSSRLTQLKNVNQQDVSEKWVPLETRGTGSWGAKKIGAGEKYGPFSEKGPFGGSLRSPGGPPPPPPGEAGEGVSGDSTPFRGGGWLTSKRSLISSPGNKKNFSSHQYTNIHVSVEVFFWEFAYNQFRPVLSEKNYYNR